MGSNTQGQQSSVQLVFQKSVFQTQDLARPISRRTTRHFRRAAWQKKEHIKCHRKKEAFRRWVQGLKENLEIGMALGKPKLPYWGPFQGVQGHKAELLLLEDSLRQK